MRAQSCEQNCHTFLAVSRREDAVVFFVEAALVVDFEAGFEAFLAAGSAFALAFVLEDVFAGLAATFGSLASFFTAGFFVVSLAPLVAVSFLAAGFFVVEDFAALVAAAGLDLVVDLPGAFLVEVVLEAFAGLF